MLLLFFGILLGYGVLELQASHHVYDLRHKSSLSLSSPETNPFYQTYRTGYHFQPRANFINDPCGPMIYKGIYHLFYQYNPDGVTFGIPVWGHSTSLDLVNWTPQPIAIQPQMASNINGSFTGSTTILLHQSYTPAILFTGITLQNEQLLSFGSSHLRRVFRQRARLKTWCSSDIKTGDFSYRLIRSINAPYAFLLCYHMECPSYRGQGCLSQNNSPKGRILTWQKAKKKLMETISLTTSRVLLSAQIVLVPQNPLMYSTPQNQINATSFRDPSTAWMPPDGKWRVIVGSKRDRLGLALLFRSKDFINWEFANRPLYSYPNTGMWECPDFFPVYINGSPFGAETSTFGPIVKHVLKVSLDDNKRDIYTIGTYDIMTDAYNPDVGFLNVSSLRYDYGKYYASKTFFDDRTKRRILLGWVNESSSLEDDMKKGWAGIHIESLRQNPVILPIQLLQGDSLFEISGITASQADVQISFRIDDYRSIENFDSSWSDPQMLCTQKGASIRGGIGPFGLLTLASIGLDEYTAVFFRIFKASTNSVVLMCSDQSRSSLNPTPDKTTYGTFVNVDPIRDGLFMRILIDHSVIESFGGKGKSVITARVYPTLALEDKAHLYAFNNGTTTVTITSLIAWSMNKANIA
ncbi:hypothetical protein RND81_05G248100 [Saponaria officinalis]|uniref:Beta-fructofuranosidase n=1 Tax=Saponaria officinalis TaxID=3572 RepID=A0AAW1L1H0_SAPOF